MSKKTKQILSFILSLMMIMSMFEGLNITSFAQDDILSYLTYEINDGEVTITKCDTSISGDVVIPDAIEGYPVTTIGDGAFYGCDNLLSITLANGVEHIYDFAFSDCENLKSIKITDSVIQISSTSFRSCKNLENIIVDKNNEYFYSDEGVLFNKDKTELIQYPIGNSRVEYAIPDGVITIGLYAFYECANLTSITMTDSVITLGYCSFYACTNLKNITFGNNLKTINQGSFYGCDSLEEITIPDSVGMLVSGAFDSCRNLKSITIPANVTTIGEGAFGYVYNNETNYNELLEGITVYGYTGTAAETYAKENGITFIAIEPEEPPVEEPPVEEPPVEEPPVEEPPVEEPPVEKPADDGKLNVKGEGGIVTDFENKISQIGTEETAQTLSSMIENENFAIVDKNGNALTEKDLVGTGSKIQILDKDGNIVNEYTILVSTDVDGNGKTTAADARLALRASAQLDNLEGVYSTAADVTGEGKITASDARKILRISAGLEK